MFNNHSLALKNCHTIISNIFSFYKIGEQHSDVYRIPYVPIENKKRKVYFENVMIYYIYTSFQICSNRSVSMGGNRELFQTEGDINCVLWFWSSITKANPCPPQQLFMFLNYILLKTSKRILQAFRETTSSV